MSMRISNNRGKRVVRTKSYLFSCRCGCASHMRKPITIFMLFVDLWWDLGAVHKGHTYKIDPFVRKIPALARLLLSVADTPQILINPKFLR